MLSINGKSNECEGMKGMHYKQLKKNKKTDVFLNTSSLNQVSRPFMFLSIFLLPVFGSTPSCPVLYLPCPCSDREIHTWRTLSVGYCMFASRHDHIHSALFFNVIFTSAFSSFQIHLVTVIEY